MSDRHFGAFENVPVGTGFENRTALSRAGVHRPLQAGISGSAVEGADSIVLSGGYVDDEDHGDIIVYTGHGGNDFGRQVRDQELTRQNAALALSCAEGLPVRVVRGSRHFSPWSPKQGYEYAGLYRVVSYWHERGRDGFLIWRFRLESLERLHDPENAPEGRIATSPGRIETTIQRIIRSTAIAQKVKEIHQHRCQICGIAIRTLAGLYGEAAHIRPLGRPHDGRDTLDNLLCLCPNHHTMFDLGGCYVDKERRIISTHNGEVLGHLIMHRDHVVNDANLAYHRELFTG